MCTTETRPDGREVTIGCGGGCGASTTSTSEVLGDVTYDKNQNPDNPLTNPK